MDLFGFDIVMVVLTTAFVSFWGLLFIAFIFFYDMNPYIPRKYYTVKLIDKDRKPIRTVKAWIVTSHKVKWLRIGLKGFPAFKGVELDIAVMETMNSKDEIEIIESIPDKYDAENYTPANIPITQKELFINKIAKLVSEEGQDTFKMKVNEIANEYSRLFDLNTSKATKSYISQARREAERAKGDDFITKYGPTIVLIFSCLFAYLILDGAGKSYQTTMAQQSAIMEHGYSQVIQQCGGVYHPLNAPKNETEKPTGTGVQIPFVNG